MAKITINNRVKKPIPHYKGSHGAVLTKILARDQTAPGQESLFVLETLLPPTRPSVEAEPFVAPVDQLVMASPVAKSAVTQATAHSKIPSTGIKSSTIKKQKKHTK